MDTLTIGFLIVTVLVGGGAFALFSSRTGAAPGILKTLGISSAAGILGGVASIFTDAYAFITACAFGELAFSGYLFVIGLAVMVGIWVWNGIQDYSKDRPITFVD